MIEVSLKVFCSYSHKDEFLRKELENHLSVFTHQGKISIWHDGKIMPGEVWDRQIKDNLNTADIILLLVSSDFMASEYCWKVEVTKAIERHDLGDACVIPIILRSVAWKYAPLFAKIQGLPKDVQNNILPVKSWTDQDAAFTNVAEGFWNAAEKLIGARKQKLNQQEETERLQRPREREEAERIRKQQEANRLQRQRREEQEAEILRLKQEEDDRLKREQEQEAEEQKRQKLEKEAAERIQRQRKEAETRKLEQEKAEKLRQNELPSDKGVDYTRLRDLLKAGEWKEADQETLKVMLKAAKREEEGWLDTNSIEQFPCTDLRTIDQLWVKYSQGKYGFSVQKKIWQKAGEKWNAFCREVGWERYAKWFFGGWVDMKSIKYQGDAPRGHLPVIDAPRVSFYMGSLLEALSRRDL